MGGRTRRSRPGVWPPVALVAGPGRWRHRSDRQPDRRDPPQSGFAPPHRDCLESRRRRQDGAAALPLPVSILRGEREAVVPALSALRRRVSGRAFQHRVLRAADHDGGAGHRPCSRDLHPHLRRRSFVSQPYRSGPAPAGADAAATSGNADQPGGEGYLRISLRGLCPRRLRPLPAYQGKGRGVMGAAGWGARIPLVLVAAVAENGVIGRAGGLPWRLKTDLKRFRALTVGHPVVMGRKTYLSFGKPLKNRTTIVVTRDPEFAAAGIVVAPSLETAMEVAEGDALRRGAAAIVVGGGADIYSKTIDKAARLEITRVHVQPEGDTVFPGIDPAQWREAARQDYAAGPDDEAPFTALTYERRDLRKTS